MANVMYAGTEFESQDVLVEASLYETLYRLEEARLGLRRYTSSQIRDALDWLASRQDASSPRLAFQRTDFDRQVTGGYRATSGEYISTIPCWRSKRSAPTRPKKSCAMWPTVSSPPC